MEEANLWQEINPKNSDGTFSVVVEIPKDSQYKYEFDLDTGNFELEKKLTIEQTFPFDYGFVPRTLGGDNDPLDVVILSNQKLRQGDIIKIKLVGIMRMLDNNEIDDKTIGIARGDVYWERKILMKEELNKEFQKIKKWFELYKKIESTKLKIIGFDDEKKARKNLNEGINKYKEIFRNAK